MTAAEYHAKWRADNHEHCLKREAEYRANNVQACRDRSRSYYQRNKKKIAERRRIQKKNRRHTDSAFRLLHVCRGRMQRVLRGYDKSAKSMELIGCTPLELQAHIESQFQPGMTWGNRGLHGWHVDHIRPCCTFDFNDPEQQRACFHYTNLRPMWAHENMTRSRKAA